MRSRAPCLAGRVDLDWSCLMSKQTLFGLVVALLGAGEPAVRAGDPPGPGGTTSAEAPAGLLEALKDKDPSVRLQAAQALIQMGQAKATLPVVEELLKSPQQGIRLEASLLFKKIQPTRLEAQLKDPNPSARLAAAQALWQMGGERMDWGPSVAPPAAL